MVDLEQEGRVLPAVARAAIRCRLQGCGLELDGEPAGALARPRPVFVTLRIDGELRGCIGELEAHCEDLVRETVDRAVAAAFEDPRFPPLTAVELERCTIEVSVLGELEPVQSSAALDPRRFGIEVSDRLGRRAVLLPGIEGVDTVEKQIEITRRKGGIPEREPITVRRFEVVKIAEE